MLFSPLMKGDSKASEMCLMKITQIAMLRMLINKEKIFYNIKEPSRILL